MTGLISRLLMPGLFAAEIWDQGQPIAVHPGEDIHVARSAAIRRRDFALGRACARAALAELGHGDAVIPKGEGGAPLWPEDIVGSITHTKGYAAAVVGKSRNFAGLGIDAEQVAGVTAGLWPRLFTTLEQERLQGQPDPQLAAALVFSAKEASYKAWAVNGPLAFREIEIALDQEGFVAAGPGASLRGIFAVDRGVVLAAAWRKA